MSSSIYDAAPLLASDASPGPTIGGLDEGVSWIEQDGPQSAAGDILFSGGANYGDGYIEFAITEGVELTDQLTVSQGGNITLDGSDVLYKGNKIGTIDSVKNGTNGEPLRINLDNPTVAGDSPIINGDFSQEGDGAEIPGWTAVLQAINLGTDEIADWPTPSDDVITYPDDTPNSDNDAPVVGNAYGEWDDPHVSIDGGRLYLAETQYTGVSKGVVHGPAAFSDPFETQQGKVLKFDWQALGTYDPYHVVGYLLNTDTGAITIAMQGWGGAGSGTASVTVPEDGSYRFVFVSGAYDGDGGTQAGAEMYIDNIRVEDPVLTDAVINELAQQIQYTTTSDNPKTEKKLSVSAATALGDPVNAEAHVEVIPVNDAPTLTDGTDPVEHSIVGGEGGLIHGDPIAATDPDGDTLSYSIVDADDPDNDGIFTLQGTYGKLTIDPATGDYTYTPDPDAIAPLGEDEPAEDTFTIRVSDGEEAVLKPVKIAITGVDDAPVVDPTQTIDLDGSPTHSGDIGASDPESGELTYQIDGGIENDDQSITYEGEYGDLVLQPDGTYVFTPDAEKIRELGAAEPGTEDIVVEVKDPSGNISSQTITVNVTGVNEAPELSDAAATLGAIDEDTTEPEGATVSALFGPAFTDPDTIPGDTLGGVAITVNDSDPAKGIWQYSLDEGTSWHDVGEVSPDHALLLDGNTKLRFDPAENWNSHTDPVPQLSAHAVDSTFAEQYTFPDTDESPQTRYLDTAAESGADSPVSADAVALQTEVIPVDDGTTGGEVSLSGIVASGETLTADVADIVDPDGPDPIVPAYQWEYQNAAGEWVPIEGATEKTYTLPDDDTIIGSPVRVVASYTDNDGFEYALPSNETVPVADAGPDSEAPIFDRATVNGNRLNLRYDDEDALDTESAPTPDQFTVMVNGVEVPVTEIAISGPSRTVVLTLETAVRAGQVVTISYDPTESATTMPIQDAAGNDAAGLLNVGATNLTSTGGGGGTPELPIGVVRDGTTETITDDDGTKTTVHNGNLGNGTVVETITEKPDGDTDYLLVYTPPATGNESVTLPLLYENIVGSDNYTAVTLPGQIKLTSVGVRTPADDGVKLDLIELIKTTVAEGEGIKPGMLDGGRDFLDAADDDANLWVNKIVLEATDDSQAPSAPIIVDGAANKDSGANLEALVIDGSGLAPDTVLELRDVDFAVVVGDHIAVRGSAGSSVVYGDGGVQHFAMGDEDDLVYGGGGNDRIDGGGGNDMLFGNHGDDQLVSDRGTDTMHGGLNNDVAIYAGNMDRYEIVRDQGLTIVRSLDNPENVDTLVNIESLQFADGTYTVENDTQLTWIASLYEQVLDRQAEVTGFQYWAHNYQAGMSIGEIGMSMLYSVEYASFEGSQFQALPVSDQIELLYQHFLNRGAEAEGHAYWTEQLEQGVNIAQIAENFIVSQEMQDQYLAPDAWDFYLL